MTDVTQSTDTTGDDQWSDRQSYDDLKTADRLNTLYDGDEQTVPDEATLPEAQDQDVTQDQGVTQDQQTESASEGPRYSPQEWATLNRVGQEIVQLRRDEAILREAKQRIANAGGDIVKAAGGDREKAAMYRGDIKELEDSIRQRQAGEKNLRADFNQRALQRHIAAGQATVFKAEPALKSAKNREGLATWLLEQGFSTEDLSGINPRQMIAAWRMFEKDKAANARPKIIPKRGRRPRKKPETESDVESEGFQSPGSQFANRFYGDDGRSNRNKFSTIPAKPGDRTAILYGAD